MQDFETPRWERAKADFAEAFALGYQRGKTDLANGATLPNAETASVFYVDVPRDDILDGEHAAWATRFESAGYEAAIAKRRIGEAVLDPRDADPDSRNAAFEGRCRWTVILRPAT